MRPGCLGGVFAPFAPLDSLSPLDALDDEIALLDRFVRELPVRAGRRLIDHALARYLWLAIQTGEVISVACRAGHPGGTATLRRFLFEILLDVHLLVSSDRLELDAARSVTWDVLDWDRVWAKHDEAVEDHPELDTGHGQSESIDEALANLRAEFEALGEDVSVFDQAAAEAKSAPAGQWHWSGKSPAGRITELGRRVGPDRVALEVVAMYRGLWKLLSSSAHPSPAWNRFKVVEESGGRLTFPDAVGQRDRFAG